MEAQRPLLTSGLPQVNALLAQFSSLVFVMSKIMDLPKGQIFDHWREECYSLSLHPETPSSPRRTLEGHFELTQRTSRAFNPALYCASGTLEIQGHHSACVLC